MGDHFVEQHYIAPDFDPTALGGGRGTVGAGYRQRMQLPFDVICSSCQQMNPAGAKLYMEKVKTDRDYLGIKIWIIHFRCRECLGTISLETSPKDTSYKLIGGGTAITTAREADKKAQMSQWAKESEATSTAGALDGLQQRSDRAASRLARADELTAITACVRDVESAERLAAAKLGIDLTARTAVAASQLKPASSPAPQGPDGSADAKGDVKPQPKGDPHPHGVDAKPTDAKPTPVAAPRPPAKRPRAEDNDVGLSIKARPKRR